MSSRFQIISPVDGSIYVERPLATVSDIDVGDNWTRINVDGMVSVIAAPTTAATGIGLCALL